MNVIFYEQFLQMFNQVFDHLPAGKGISEQLLSIRQGHRSSKSDWNDPVLKAVYHRGLNAAILNWHVKMILPLYTT